MNKIFYKIGRLIEKSPFKVLMVSLLIVAVLITGAIKVNMATGNETLVQSDSEAYMANHNMEADFGGDAMMILLNGDQTDLYSYQNIEKLWNVEQRLKYEEGIYSLMSPASVVHQITDKQASQIKDNMPEISDGLGQMSEKLIEVGTELGSKTLPDPAEIEKKLDDLMGNMDPDQIMEDLLKEQEAGMADMEAEVSTMSGGLVTMGDQLITVGTELGGKEIPSPEEIEKKLDGLMGNMDPDQIMADLLKQQEAGMADMEKEISAMSGGLAAMGDQLIGIGAEISSQEVADPAEIEEKLNSFMAIMDPEKLMQDMLEDQEAAMRDMEVKIGEMSSQLSGMGNGLLEISGKFTSMDSSDLSGLGEKLNELEAISEKFDDLIDGQLQLESGIANLGEGLSESASGLDLIAEQLDVMTEQAADPELKQQLIETTEKIGQSAQGLGTMSDQTTDLKSIAGGTSAGLETIKQNLQSEIAAIKESLPEASPDQFTEISTRLSEMGNGLISFSESILTMPEEIAGSLGEGPAEILSDMKAKMETEIADMKSSLSGGMDPEGLKSMAQGLTTMGEKLKEMGGGISNLPDKMSEALTGSMDPSALFAAMMTDIEADVEDMKSSLTGGIDPEELKTMADGFVTMGENLKEMGGGIANLPDKIGETLSASMDPSVLFSGMMADIENEVTEMKSSLSGGIDPDELATMADGFVTMGENLEELSEGLETFHEKSGMLAADIPHDQKELDNIWFEEDGTLREVFSDTVIDDEHMMVMIKLEGNIDDGDKDALFLDVTRAMEQEYSDTGNIDYVISGKPVLDSSLRQEMKSNMQLMVVMAVFIMLAILFFIFNVRWKILSIGVILVSVIATLGLMGHLSVSMTMVSMAVFPILIGLGIDYSIQFHNRYEEERSVTNSLSQIGKAVAVAVFATMLGFISLYASPVPMIKDFGKMLTIGVIISFLGSIFLLMPILKIRDQVNPKSKPGTANGPEEDGMISRLLGKTAKLVTKFAPLVLIIAVSLAGLGLAADSRVGVETDIETFMPQEMAALGDIHYVRDVVGSTDQMVLYLKDDNILAEENIAWIQNKVEVIKTDFQGQVEDVRSIDNLVENFSDQDDLSYAEYLDAVNDIPDSQRSMFLSEDGTKGAVILNIRHMPTEQLQRFVEDMRETLKGAPMEVSVTGKSVLDVEMVKGLTEGRVMMTILGIGLVFAALLLIYRNLFKALIPVLPIILIVGMSGGIMYLLGLKYTPITATLGALILGMGTEMTIMLLERYMEERSNNKSKAEAMAITVKRIGKATLASGLTTIGGFSVLMFSNFVILKDFGLMTVINVSLALVSTFVILPAVIWIFDRFIVKEASEESAEEPYWDDSFGSQET